MVVVLCVHNRKEGVVFEALIPLVGQISLFHQSPVDQSEVLPPLFVGKKAVEGVLVFDRRVRGLKGEKQ